MVIKKKNNTVNRKAYLIDEKNSPFIVTESFRNLATNIGFAIPQKNGKGKVVCITSSVAGEGKTTVAVNVALTCAKSGAKTVLVDCDLRKPRIKHYFKIDEKEAGVISYLSGRNTLQEVICQSVVPGLDVIIGFQSAPNPIVLLNDESFDRLLDALSAEYDYVILDTPPVGIVADATIIGKKTDGVVIVTRQMYSNHKILRDVVKQLEFAQCRVLGFVLNAFSMQNTGYYGGKYGYKYKYGYASKEEKNKAK